MQKLSRNLEHDRFVGDAAKCRRALCGRRLSNFGVFEDEPRAAISGQAAHPRRGAKDRGEHREAAGAIRSVIATLLSRQCASASDAYHDEAL
jgi:hypothetical protein